MTGRLLVWVALGCLAGPVPAAAQQSTRARLARIELEGPLDAATFRYPDGSETRVDLRLERGERRGLEVPLTPPAGAFELPPAVEVAGPGRARFEGWSAGEHERLEQAWSRVSLGVRQRPLPPAPDDAGARSRGRAPPGATLIAAAAFLVGLRWRYRPVVAVLAGLGGAAAVLLVTASGPRAERALRLIEGEVGNEHGSSVRVARERLVLQPGEAWRIQTLPGDLPLRVRVDPGSQAPWTFEAERATLYQLDPVVLPGDPLRRNLPNRLGLLEETWVRDEGGAWSRRGAWPLDAPLPPALAGAGEPPGWINPALPLGIGVLVGRRGPTPARSGEAEETWVRFLGF